MSVTAGTIRMYISNYKTDGEEGKRNERAFRVCDQTYGDLLTSYLERVAKEWRYCAWHRSLVFRRNLFPSRVHAQLPNIENPRGTINAGGRSGTVWSHASLSPWTKAPVGRHGGSERSKSNGTEVNLSRARRTHVVAILTNLFQGYRSLRLPFVSSVLWDDSSTDSTCPRCSSQKQSRAMSVREAIDASSRSTQRRESYYKLGQKVLAPSWLIGRLTIDRTHRSSTPGRRRVSERNSSILFPWSKHFAPAVASVSKQVSLRSRASFHSRTRCAPSIEPLLECLCGATRAEDRGV